MRSSIVIIAAFVIGCAVAAFGIAPEWLTRGDLATWILYVLILQVGIGVGSDSKMKELVRNISPKLLLLPVATIVGSLLASFAISFALSRWSASEVIAAGSGFGYYSLSSILITSLKEASLGAKAAAELGTIALIANIFREILTLTASPLLAKWFGPIAPICAGGATTMDVTLSAISKASGKEWVVASMLHGIIVDFSVPLLVPFFCGIG